MYDGYVVYIEKVITKTHFVYNIIVISNYILITILYSFLVFIISEENNQAITMLFFLVFLRATRSGKLRVSSFLPALPWHVRDLDRALRFL